MSQLGWHLGGIPAFQKLNKEDPEFKASLGYLVEYCLNKEKEREKHTEKQTEDSLWLFLEF